MTKLSIHPSDRHKTVHPLSRTESGEDFVRVHHAAFDEGGVVGLALKLGHGSDQAEPVQHLVLAGIFDLSKRTLAPRSIVSGLEGAVQERVGFSVRIEMIRLLGQKGVRPARRRDECNPPRAIRHSARAGSAELKAARGRRRWWIELLCGQLLANLAEIAA